MNQNASFNPYEGSYIVRNGVVMTDIKKIQPELEVISRAAEAMEKKAEAYAKYNKAAVAEMMIKVLPDIAAKVAEPLGQIDKITIIGGGEGGNGVDQVAGNVPVVMAKVFESMKEATGIDLADIINAESYDAQVNRNINVSGLDSVNLVVKDEKKGAGQPDAQDGATTE